MKAAIICIGTEILFGDTVNTNAAFLGKFLAHLEVHTMRMEVVGDNAERIRATFERVRGEHDLVIFTGGLGPTVDDITKEVVCEAMGLKLVPDSDSMASMLRRMGPAMTENNYKQAYFPEGAVILRNTVGTAPGMYYDAGDYKVVLLPGPPSEMIPMCENELYPILQQQVNSALFSTYLHVYGIGESKLEDMLKDILQNQKTVKIGTYMDADKVTLRLSSSDPNKRRQYLNECEAQIRKILKDYIITVDEERIESLLINTLSAAKLKLCVAESCTGGMLAARITSMPGASAVFGCGMVTYTNDFKNKYLGVDKNTLKMHTAVSEHVSFQMAKGIGLATGADITCSITGYAGSEVQQEHSKQKRRGTIYLEETELRAEKQTRPVGKVFITIWSRYDHAETKEFNFKGNREQIRRAATKQAMLMLTSKAISLANKNIRRK